jgi:hypothetical protein
VVRSEDGAVSLLVDEIGDVAEVDEAAFERSPETLTGPGAIGFVKAADFHGDGSDGGVKSVKIDGIAASDTGYKLRM